MTARILVVDDNPLNQKLLVAKLTHDYYVTQVADNGRIALEMVAKAPPDLILLDVMMPELNGFDTCRKLKSDPETAHIPVVMVTALSDVADRVQGLEAGADDFLTKPINDQALMARVRSLLRLKLVMDEWRQRENLAHGFAAHDNDEPLLDVTGGKVLLVNDQPFEQRFIADTLFRISLETVVAGSSDQAMSLVEDDDFMSVIISLSLGDMDGLRLVAQIRSHEDTRLIPILLMAGPNEVERVSKGLDLGANDYLVQPFDANELIARTRTQIKQKMVYDRMRQNYENSLALAMVDPLTGLFNRRYLELRMPRAFKRARQNKAPICVLMCDLDHFKSINDRYGHAAGDEVLKQVASMIAKNLRPFDIVARVGGEEFVVLMPGSSADNAFMVAERLRSRIAETPIKIDDKNTEIVCTMSIGCTEVSPGNTETDEQILKHADDALYEAKKAGRNCIIIHTTRPSN